jgi:diphthamide biosynthesis protein 4
MDFYAILGLPPPSSNSPPSPQLLKDAYRRALLTNHPDKATDSVDATSKPSIDEITLAFRTLSSPVLRAAHDRELSLRKEHHSNHRAGGEAFHTGLESVDLDDLTFDDPKSIWYRGCRCGQSRGYILEESQLEEAADAGETEVFVGCRGCSLWLKVSFAVAEEEEKVQEDTNLRNSAKPAKPG